MAAIPLEIFIFHVFLTCAFKPLHYIISLTMTVSVHQLMDKSSRHLQEKRQCSLLALTPVWDGWYVGVGFSGICRASLRSNFIPYGGTSTACRNYWPEQSLRTFHVVQVVVGENNSFIFYIKHSSNYKQS